MPSPETGLMPDLNGVPVERVIVATVVVTLLVDRLVLLPLSNALARLFERHDPAGWLDRLRGRLRSG
jgi:hypothetical protein